MNKQACVDYTQVVLAIILCLTLLTAYYLYIDHQIRMLANKPDTKNKITIRVLAAGFAMAYSVMLFPTSKEALDFQLYGLKIELYALIKAVLFLGTLGFGLITGGTFLSNIKGNARN